jgi:hypothetical protein
MRPELFSPTVEGEARLLILVNAFTGPTTNLDGRTKMAKLDFFLRYPAYLRRAVAIRQPQRTLPEETYEEHNIEQRMVRWRYGPWDPAYFTLLGCLLGKELIVPISHRGGGVAYRTTDTGRGTAKDLAGTEAWHDVAVRAATLKTVFGPVTGEFLKKFIYQHFPEVAGARWETRL